MAASFTRSTQIRAASQQLVPFRGYVYTMVAAFLGVVFGIVGSLGFVTAYMQSQLAMQHTVISQEARKYTPSAQSVAYCASIDRPLGETDGAERDANEFSSASDNAIKLLTR